MAATFVRGAQARRPALLADGGSAPGARKRGASPPLMPRRTPRPGSRRFAPRAIARTCQPHMVHDDKTGPALRRAAFVEKAREGCRSASSTTGSAPWGRPTAASGANCGKAGWRCGAYNPPRLDQPLGWISRDHRKCLVVDGQVAFVTGLCVGRKWEGVPERGLAGLARHRGRGSRPRGGRGGPRLCRLVGRNRPAPRSGRRGDRPSVEGDWTRASSLDTGHPPRSSPRSAGGFPGPPHALAHRRLLSAGTSLYAAPLPLGGSGRRRRQAPGARSGQRRSLHAIRVPRRVSRPAGGGRAHLRMERPHAPRQDRGGGRALGARGLHQPQPDELDGEPRAGRGGGERGLRGGMEGDVRTTTSGTPPRSFSRRWARVRPAETFGRRRVRGTWGRATRGHGRARCASAMPWVCPGRGARPRFRGAPNHGSGRAPARGSGRRRLPSGRCASWPWRPLTPPASLPGRGLALLARARGAGPPWPRRIPRPHPARRLPSSASSSSKRASSRT